MKVGIIGAGAWGTAIGVVAAQGGSDVILWSFDGLYKEFDGVTMPKNLRVTTDMSEIAQTDVWVAVTPSAFFRETMARTREFYNNQPVIICTKGAESKTCAFMSEILNDVLPECTDYGVLSGPQFAAEVARGCPTGSTLAAMPRTRVAGHKIFNKIYLSDSDDIIGTEYCGVGKNAVALICGYNCIATSSENERALVFTRAWNEVVAMGCALGAHAETFLDLCGIGDLFLCATSPTSRNFAGGMALARGEKVIGTVEGMFAVPGLIARAEKIGVKTPVLKEMCEKMKL